MLSTPNLEKTKKFNLRRSLIKVSIAPFVILLVLSTVFIGQIFRLIEMNHWIDRSDQVIAKIYENEKLILDLQTGIRGFVTTSKPEFLESYEKNRSNIDFKLEELKVLLAYRPSDVTRLSLATVEIRKFKENAKELLSLKILPSYHAKFPIDLIMEQQKIVDTFSLHLDSLLEETQVRRTNRVTETNQAVEWSIGIGIALTLFLSSFFAHFLWRKITTIANIYENALKLAQNSEAGLIQTQAELEEKVLKRTFALTLANKELEAFSYSVSHDLRAPLRGIDGFSQALLEDYSGILDDTAKQYLNHVRAGTQKMGKLIDDMLNLAKLSRLELIPKAVNLSHLAHTAAKQLKELEPKRKVSFKISEDLIANGDPGLLSIVIDNLFSNAWKFTAKSPDALIEFGLSDSKEKPTYFIKDNGVGFNMAYSNKLFGTFQRLHSEKDFQGNGVGLAIIRRVITRHGGEVWAESKVNEGATFYFTLQNS